MKREQYALMREFEDDFFWFVGIHELALSFLERFFVPGRSMKILDAGCGTGGLLQYLSRYGEAFGIDVSEDALNFCRQRGLENVRQADLSRWSPPPMEYDIITCMDVLYHEAVVSDAELLMKFHTSLKPAGKVILNVPAFEALRRRHDERVETRKRYKKKDLESALRSAGFNVKVMTYRLPLLFPVLLMRKFTRDQRGASRVEDIRALPPALNRALLQMHRWENSWILKGGSFPFGSSLFAVAEKR